MPGCFLQREFAGVLLWPLCFPSFEQLSSSKRAAGTPRRSVSLATWVFPGAEAARQTLSCCFHHCLVQKAIRAVKQQHQGSRTAEPVPMGVWALAWPQERDGWVTPPISAQAATACAKAPSIPRTTACEPQQSSSKTRKSACDVPE